ncbi:MAG: saccharopine dehydrogenase C-terminal domain-containing protein [Ignavibacteriaceae bacterium]
MQKVIILGGGMVGSAIAADLSSDYKVTVADIDEPKLQKIKLYHSLDILQSDISSDINIKTIIKDFDLVIGAVPGHMGFSTLKSVIEAKKNIVDISFFGEDPFELGSLAKENGVTAIVDCGIAPGFSNIILGYQTIKMKINSFECYVGGLPFKRMLPFQYKAPFSPKDVIEEYVRPSRIVRDGNVIIKPALSDPELIEFENIGTLEAFNTDGLRSLIKTMSIPNMIEKTLRYPGHIDLMRTLRDTGFFDKEEMEFDGANIRPVDFTSKLLFPHWKLEENEKEFTILRLTIEGDGKTITYDLFDKFDEETKTTSMARTTGYTCSAVARLVLEGRYSQKGISPPEFIGMQSQGYEFVTDYLSKRKISFSIREQEIK